MNFKRFTALALVIMMVFALCPTLKLSVQAQDMTTKKYVLSNAKSSFDLADYVDPEVFEEYLITEFYTCPDYVDISSFGIPNSTDAKNALKNFIWCDTPELFHIYAIGFSGMGNTISQIHVQYYYDQEQYSTMMEELYNESQKFLTGIKGNDSLSDLEKALLIHDRIALNTVYDYPTVWADKSVDENHNAYGPIVLGKAVCQGYAMAYSYLLDQVGIQNEYCASETMNHGWSIVYINGTPYHVDVTWDDGYIEGEVSHDNFLKSTSYFKSNGHNANDYSTLPADSTYDSFFWDDVYSSFELIDDTLYFIERCPDNAKTPFQKLYGYKDGATFELHTIESTWWANKEGGYYWIPNYSRLSANGITLFFSVSDGIYSFDPQTEAINLELTFESETEAIYGFIFKNNSFVYCTAISPNAYLPVDEASYLNYKTHTQAYSGPSAPDPEPDPKPIPQPQLFALSQMFVGTTGAGALLYASPDDSADPIRTLNGVTVTAIGYTEGDEWYMISVSPEEEGFIKAESLTNEASLIEAMGITVKEDTGLYLQPGTTLGALNEKVPSIEITAVNAKGQELTADSFIGTGADINIGTQSLSVSILEIIVSGDLNGDGKLAAMDYFNLRRVLSGYIILGDTENLAADFDKNGRLSSMDYVRLRLALMAS